MLLSSVLAGCQGGGRPAVLRAQPGPILLVGLDGFEWDIVLRMLPEGRLPVVRGLMERGTFGLLKSQLPSISPVIWTTIATGKPPDKHGVHGFIHEAAVGEQPRLYTSQDRRTKAFWNIFSEHGRRVHVVGWWLTYPVEPINGVMVAQANTLQVAKQRHMLWKGGLVDGLADQVHPPERQAAFLEMTTHVQGDLRALMNDVFGGGDGRGRPRTRALAQETKWALRADAVYERIALVLLTEKPTADLVAVYFGGTDVVGHRFWPDPPAAPVTSVPAAEAFGGAIPRYYAHVDAALGRFLKACPDGTTVVVLSDHGMGPHGHLDGPDGFLVAAGPRIRNGAAPVDGLTRAALPTLGSTLDVTPTLLRLAGLPLAKDMDGRVMEGLLPAATTPRSPSSAVATYDTEQWLADRRARPRAPDMDPDRLEQLRALGYIK